MREEADGYRFEIELPGIAPEQVEVTLEQGVLTVRGEKRATTATTTEAAAPKWHVAERVQGAFKRTFQLPQAVSEDRIARELRQRVADGGGAEGGPSGAERST